MKNRFIIAADNFSTASVRVFSEFLDCYDCAWWHWIQNIWLVVDYKGKLTKEIIADKLNEIDDASNNLVFKIDRNVDWYGYGPTKKDSTYFNWIQENWKNE